MADAGDLKSPGRKAVRVRFPPRPSQNLHRTGHQVRLQMSAEVVHAERAPAITRQNVSGRPWLLSCSADREITVRKGLF